MKNAEFACLRFDEGFNCAESVLYSAIKDEKNIDIPMCLSACSGFGGGMGRKQKVCGAITGAVMAIGLLKSPYIANGSGKTEHSSSAIEIKNHSYQLVNKFVSQFESEFGSANCLDLLNRCDLNTPEGKELFNTANMKQQLCHKYVRYAAEYLEKLNDTE